jgi:hypothetical protein
VQPLRRATGLLPLSGRRPLSKAADSEPSSAGREENWHPEEFQRWEFGRRKLAAMMGQEEVDFTEGEVEKALRYLLPTSLSARDARPLMKHPSHVFDKRKGILCLSSPG